ncbi:MAG: DUF927 domain-containing protein [Desulfovibrionaceae bacterium]|nr:DUF927 domain-containing protein [Desulfovibrionaceae bacterium]
MSDNTLAAALETLKAHGLMLDAVEADGTLHYCGTTEKPRSQNGRYIFHADAWPTLWWQNYNTGEIASSKLYDTATLSTKERKAEQEAIAARKREREAEQSTAWAQAAEQAQAMYAKTTAADNSHAYLCRKGVHSVEGLRILGKGDNAVLVVPVHNIQGLAQSLQYIQPNGAKLFLPKGKIAGGFFPIPARDGSKEGTLLIAEGIATALSLHEATGFAVLVAFNCGNMLPVARIAREQYPAREIVLCADNDAEGKKPNGEPYNIGIEKATSAAREVGAKLALCPAHEGKPTDFNDLHQWRGLDAVAAVIEAARNIDAGCPMPKGFYMVEKGKDAGIYWVKTNKSGEDEHIRIAPPLTILGFTFDAEGSSWGLLLEWRDPNNKVHQWAMPLRLLNELRAEWFGILVDSGFLGIPAFRNKLSQFLADVRPVGRVRCVSTTGWHDTSFVLPDAVFGAQAGKIVLQSSSVDNIYKVSGTMEQWQKLAALVAGNSRLEFALYVALAGAFLCISGMESGGFNLVGLSSSGKSTALRLAASVWGGKGYVRNWRTTDNALEGLAALHNDALLILDEISQAPARVVSEASYMLANGTGKARANKNGDTRKLQSWRLMFLSSGEAGLAERLAEIGQRVKAGQEVRLVDIIMDAGQGMRSFDTLNGIKDASSYAIKIKELAEANYGHAGRALVQAMTTDDGSLAKGILVELRSIVNDLCPADADGQVRRVAMRFALCMVAGEYAQNAGILPASFTPEATIQRLFKEWLAERGGAGASEDTAIMAAVRLFIEMHGVSRFEDLDSNAEQRVINRVGYRRKNNGITEYMILPEAFKTEVLRGFTVKQACRVLAQAGWLYQGSKGRYVSRPVIRDVQTSCYIITPHDGGENY